MFFQCIINLQCLTNGISRFLVQGLLVFAESTGLPISVYFDEPGRFVFTCPKYYMPHVHDLSWMYRTNVINCVCVHVGQ